MDTTEIAFDFPPFIRVYKDGRVERLSGNETVPPSISPDSTVSSKDTVIVPETGVSARLYLPKLTNTSEKLPLLVYFHGGAFCIESAFSPTYHNYLNSLVSQANVVVVSVDYRRAPEYPLPIAYNDSWAAVEWVASHPNGSGQEIWLNDHVDFRRVFFAGDSAGANIAHNTAIRAKEKSRLPGLDLIGIILIHPFFCGVGPVDKSWFFMCPGSSGSDDPLINPAADPDLPGLGCTRVLVCVAEKDGLRDRGCFYYETLKKSGWGGALELMEAQEEDHVFHLFNHTCEKAVDMMKKVVVFINQY